MIRLVELSKSFGEKTILRCVSMHFNPGERYGLVGANGAGKTTLLRMITQQESVDSGEIVVPRGCVIAHLPQYPNPKPQLSVTRECMSGFPEVFEKLHRVNELATKLAEHYSHDVQEEFEAAETACRHAGGYVIESNAKELLCGLGFRQEELVRNPLEFSGGWRMRLELAKILLRQPGVLVLDEPTNHLDLPSIAWLEKRLKNFAGTLIYVSHDRSLLNRLSTRILHIQSGFLREYFGNFDDFLEQFDAAQAGQAKEREKLAAQAKKLEDFAMRFGAKATLASRAKSKLKMAQKLRSLEEELVSQSDATDKELSINIPAAPNAPRTVVRFDELVVGHNKPLIRPFSATIERSSKVAVIGANGAGKSTLLRTLLGEVAPISGKCIFGENVVTAYFAQEQAEVLDLGQTILEAVLGSSAAIDEKKARALLGALKFSGLEVHKKVGVLSGGETNRVGLACLLSGHSNLLILDEPTNHLDMSSVENLAAALQSFQGTVIFVSHNRDFIDDVCTHVLAVARDGQVGLFEGQLEDYERACAFSGFPNVLNPDALNTAGSAGSASANRAASKQSDPSIRQVETENARSSWADAKEAKRERARVRKEIDKTDARLAELERLRLSLSEKMHSTDSEDYLEVVRLGETLATLGKEIEELELRWLELNETLEGLQRDEFPHQE